MPEAKLVVVEKFFNPTEAQVAKSLLADAGILSFLLDENASYSIGTAIVLGGYRLAVADSDLSDEQEILNEFKKLNSDIQEEEIRCPKCQSSLTSNKTPFSLITIIGLVFSSLFLLLTNSSPRYHCKRCKYKWDENKRA